MKKGIFIVNYELIRVYTMLHKILGTQKGRRLWDGNGGKSFANLGSFVWDLLDLRNSLTGIEFKSVLGIVGGELERSPDLQPSYLEVMNLGVSYKNIKEACLDRRLIIIKPQIFQTKEPSHNAFLYE